MNHIIGNKIEIIGLILPSSDHVSHHIAVRVPNSNAATHIHTTNQINIFPKKDHIDTSLGALSKIATSGFFIFLSFCKESIQI
jgi:hypothetical protein